MALRGVHLPGSYCSLDALRRLEEAAGFPGAFLVVRQ